MANNEARFGSLAHRQIGRGIDLLANRAKSTLGPRGRRAAPLATTTPGASATENVEAENVEPEDERSEGDLFDLGARMVKEVVSRTAAAAGDGTKTATVIAQAIYNAALAQLAAGADPSALERGIEASVQTVVGQLRRQARPPRSEEELRQVATISANGDAKIAALVTRALDNLGTTRQVVVEEASTTDSTLEIVDGMQLDQGYPSPCFATRPDDAESVLEDAYVLIHDCEPFNLVDIQHLLELVAESGRPLLIVSADLDTESLASFVLGELRGTLKLRAVRAAGSGVHQKEALRDLAAFCGALAGSDEIDRNFARFDLRDLGRARRITFQQGTTTIIDGGGNSAEVAARLNHIRSQLEDATADPRRFELRQRIANLSSGVALIRVGGETEAARKEKRWRLDRASRATRAATEEGIVPGGGVALLRALPALEMLELGADEQLGVGVVAYALEAPLRQMAHNAGIDAAAIAIAVRAGAGGYGYNLASSCFEDLTLAGVVDPVKVLRVALETAASGACSMLTTGATVASSSPSTSGNPTGRLPG